MAVFGDDVGAPLARGQRSSGASDHAAFGEAVARLSEGWPVQAAIVIGEQEKRRSVPVSLRRRSRQVGDGGTLELALAGVPMVAAYRTGGRGVDHEPGLIRRQLGHSVIW